MYVTQRFARADPGNFASGTNEVLTITYAAPARGLHHIITGVAWSFSGDPVDSPALTIMDGANVVFEVQILDGGPGEIYFNPAMMGSANGGMSVTLGAGGAGVDGRLNVLGHWVE
jgi:hypothetical protein